MHGRKQHDSKETVEWMVATVATARIEDRLERVNEFIVCRISSTGR